MEITKQLPHEAVEKTDRDPTYERALQLVKGLTDVNYLSLVNPGMSFVITVISLYS